MKRIHFENLSWNWFRIILLIIATLCLISGYVLNFENGIIILIGFLIPTILLSKRFWYKNYVEYNKLGIIIKFNYITDETVKFKDIKDIEINDKMLKLSLSNNTKLNFKMNKFDNSDINKLTRILVENSNSKFTDNRSGINTIANIGYK